MVTRFGLLVFAGVVLGTGAACAAAFQIYGPERLWARSGPADLGDVDFATLSRRDTPNDALACGAGLCASEANMPAPVFDLGADDLFYRVQQAVADEPRLVLMAKEKERGVLRYVQRSRFFRFPDTINVKVVALPDGRSAVLIYSRSQIGRGDMGVNRARIERWVKLIEAAVAQK
jgi:uncharacterized protein (DUF1499 family)